MRNYYVETNPLAAIDKCDGAAVERYLEGQLTKGLSLVAVVDYAGTPHWVFRAVRAAKPEPVTLLNVAKPE
jgi:hypothetical protein